MQRVAQQPAVDTTEKKFDAEMEILKRLRVGWELWSIEIMRVNVCRCVCVCVCLIYIVSL